MQKKIKGDVEITVEPGKVTVSTNKKSKSTVKITVKSGKVIISTDKAKENDLEVSDFPRVTPLCIDPVSPLVSPREPRGPFWRRKKNDDPDNDPFGIVRETHLLEGNSLRG